MAHESSLRRLIFYVYIAYFALNVLCAVLLVRGEAHALVWVVLVTISTLHLASLLAGACLGKLGLLQDHRAYPFASDTNGFLVAIYLSFDLALCVALGANVLRMAQDKEENVSDLVALLCASTVTNALCFYKFYYLQIKTASTYLPMV